MSDEIEIGEATQEETGIDETCGHCGYEVDPDSTLACKIDGEWLDVCHECYDQNTDECQMCGEDIMRGDRSEFVLFKAELATIPGIYRIQSYPFLLCPMIGSTSLFSDSVLFIDRLPRRDDHYEISGHICGKCARPYQRTYVQAFKPVPWMMRRTKGRYPGCKTKESKWRAILNGTRYGRAVVAQHTRSVILANPNMLRDMECDADDHDWEELKERLRLPDLPTFHEWIYVEHRGVRVYTTGGDTWFTLRAEPKYRSCYRRQDDQGNNVLFAASSLPTAENRRHAYLTRAAIRMKECVGTFESAQREAARWIKDQREIYGVSDPDEMGYWRDRCSGYESERAIARDSIRDAIEAGFIRQEGTYDDNGERKQYG